MVNFRKIISLFYILLTLLFSAQAYSLPFPDFDNNPHQRKGLEFHVARYDLLAISDKKQTQENTPDPNILLVKSLRTGKSVESALSNRFLIVEFCYFINSDNILVNLTSHIIVYPFHCFG
jgi:hypothetical protein